MSNDDRSESAEARDPLGPDEWKEVWARMCRVIASVSKGRLDAEEIQDCAQEASIALYRSFLGGQVRNLEALSVHVAKTTTWKELKRRGFKAGAKAPGAVNIDDILDRLIDPARDPGDAALLPEEVQFYVQELLLLLKAKCRDLFSAWLGTLNQKHVAEALGMSHDNVRQSWLRCRKHALNVALADRGPLGDWFRDQAGGELA